MSLKIIVIIIAALVFTIILVNKRYSKDEIKEFSHSFGNPISIFISVIIAVWTIFESNKQVLNQQRAEALLDIRQSNRVSIYNFTVRNNANKLDYKTQFEFNQAIQDLNIYGSQEEIDEFKLQFGHMTDGDPETTAKFDILLFTLRDNIRSEIGIESVHSDNLWTIDTILYRSLSQQQ